jgi:putative peptidoglycan lipid II flippase
MNRILKRANSRISLGSAAFLLSATAFIGAFLGILRTKLINANFINFESDAYFAAFKIPDFLFFTLASGALGVAFLPILSEKLQQNKQAAWQISSYILNFLAIIAFAASIIVIIFAEPLIKYIVAPGFTPEQLQLSVSMMRIISVNIFLFAISTVLTTMQQSIGRFFFMAIAPLFYNGSIIISIFVFGESLGIVGVAIGVAIGAILQLIVVAFGMLGMNYRYKAKIDFKNKSFREVLRIMPARSIDQGVDYINGIAETRFASKLPIGSVTNYENAFILHNAPIMLIGNSISTAAFPRLTTRLAQGKVDLFRRDFIQVLSTMIWIALPVVIVSYFARGYLARIIFARSNKEIAIIFGFLCIAIFFRIIYTIISRYFYAYKDTKTPLYVSLFIIVLNIFLAYNLSKPEVYGVAGLAIAQGIVAFVEVFILVAFIVRRDRNIFTPDFFNSMGKMVSVTGFTAIATLFLVRLFPLGIDDRGFELIAKLGIISATTFFVYIMISYLFAMPEAKVVVNKIKSIILKPIKI